MNSPIQTGVIGYGYWGPNMVRNLTGCPDTHVKVVVDRDRSRLDAAQALYPWVTGESDAEALFADPEIQAVVVATPMATHHSLAKAALESGKHVLVEKPLAMSAPHCEELIALAKKHERTLMVDHTFVYTGAVRKIREIVESGHLGRLLYFDSVRINLGLIQQDSNVLWDLAPHDLAILDYVVGQQAEWVSAVGARHYGTVETLAYLTLGFPDDLLAHLHCNWISPVKVRQIILAGTERMLLYDDNEPSEKVKIYESGVTLAQTDTDRDATYRKRVEYRTGDVLAPKLDRTEALQLVVQEFATSIRTGSRPRTDAAAGLRVVRALEAAQGALRDEGARIQV